MGGGHGNDMMTLNSTMKKCTQHCPNTETEKPTKGGEKRKGVLVWGARLCCNNAGGIGCGMLNHFLSLGGMRIGCVGCAKLPRTITKTSGTMHAGGKND